MFVVYTCICRTYAPTEVTHGVLTVSRNKSEFTTYEDAAAVVEISKKYYSLIGKDRRLRFAICDATLINGDVCLN